MLTQHYGNIYNTPMSTLVLEPENQLQIAELLTDDGWIVACLCAAWCDVCAAYRAGFDAFAAEHPDKVFLWIDIEDQAELVGDLEIDNFPTLLLQRGDTVTFFGTVQPDLRVAKKLLSAYTQKTIPELQAETAGNPVRQSWQDDCNLRHRLQNA